MNHAGTLRVSLLLALGVIPIACGDTMQGSHDDGGGDTGGVPETRRTT